jgi:hypothetical protein
MKIAVADLRPNPFRDLKRYPVQPEKVEALKRSIKDTSFWDNLLARKPANGSGGYEVAYGHNRLKALRELQIEAVDIPVRDLSDTDMARIMAHENMEEWGHSTVIEQETLRAIVVAYAEGRIELPKPKHHQSLRHAPQFTVGSSSDSGASKPYTSETLAEFLGWKQYKVDATLAALALIEDGLANDEQFAGLSTKQAEAIATETRRVFKETGKPALAKAVGNRLAAGMKQATKGRDRAGRERNVRDVTIHNARDKANDMIRHAKLPQPKKIPPLDDFAEQLANLLGDVFPTPRMEEKLKAVIQYRREEAFSASKRRTLINALRALAKRAAAFADKLEG